MKMGFNWRWWRWWPFGLLCLLAAVRGLFEESYPQTGSTLGSLAAGCGAAAVFCFVYRARQRGTVAVGRDELGWAAAGAMLLGGPYVGLLAGSALEANPLVMALALTPVVAGVAAIAMGESSSQSLAGRVWPGLAAIAGLLLLIPQPSLASVKTDVLLALAPLLTGVGGAWFCREGKCVPGTRAAAALSGAGLMFGAVMVVQVLLRRDSVQVSVVAAVIDAVFALLAVMSLARLGATRWAGQFVLVPLMVLLEGLALIRPRVDVRMVTGLVLLVLAVAFLLLPQSDEDESEAPRRSLL